MHPSPYLSPSSPFITHCVAHCVPTACKASCGGIHPLSFLISSEQTSPISVIPSRSLEAAPGRCPRRPGRPAHIIVSVTSPWYASSALHCAVDDLDGSLLQYVRHLPWRLKTHSRFPFSLFKFQPRTVLWVSWYLGAWTSRMGFSKEWSSFPSLLGAAHLVL